MNTKESAEIWMDYLDNSLYIEEPKELIQLSKEMNEPEVELTIEIILYNLTLGSKYSKIWNLNLHLNMFFLIYFYFFMFNL